MVGRVLVIVAMLLSVAYADKKKAPPAVEPEKPWAKGVSKEDQTKALALFQQGNIAFETSEYRDALPKYEEALVLWKHPAIYYNAAVCLMNLDRTVEALDHFEAALQYGEAPLGSDLFGQGKNYQKVLSLAVGEVTITSTQDSEVRLDGVVVLTKPGTITKRLPNGGHQIVATKPGYMTGHEEVKVNGHDKQTVTMTLKVPPVVTRKLQRRWEKWKPYGVIVAGSVVALAGPPLLALADHDRLVHDAYVDLHCPTGCSTSTLPSNISVDGKRATIFTDVAIGSFIAGGAVIATGFLLVLLNQPRLAPVAPVVGSDHVGLAISVPW